MQRLAGETGGGFFEVSSDHPIDKIYAQIEDELRNQYSIGYTPNRIDTSGMYRKLKLTTDQKRPGCPYARTDTARLPPGEQVLASIA
jgi:hypothetical protein